MKSILELTTEKQIRNRLKYLYQSIKELTFSECNGVLTYYLQALRSRHIRKIAFFEKFGPTPRHQIENMAAYVNSRRFGYTAVHLDKYNWLDKPDWVQKVRYNLPSILIDNAITLAEGKNHKWTFGISIYFPLQGSGFAPSISGEIFDSKEACLKAAAYKAKRDIQKTLECESFKEHKDSVKTAKSILIALDELIASETQLSLF